MKIPNSFLINFLAKVLLQTFYRALTSKCHLPYSTTLYINHLYFQKAFFNYTYIYTCITVLKVDIKEYYCRN